MGFFSGRSDKQDDGPRPGLWLAETFLISLKPPNRIQRKSTGIKILTSSTNFVFFGPIWIRRWPHRALIGWNIFNFSVTAEWSSSKLDWTQVLNLLWLVCLFGASHYQHDVVFHSTKRYPGARLWPFEPLVFFCPGSVPWKDVATRVPRDHYRST